VTLATVGPFTLTGECYVNGSGSTVAQTYVATTQDHSALDDYDSAGTVQDWMSATIYPIGYSTTGVAGAPDFRGASDGSAGLESADGATFLDVLPGSGVYVGSAGGATVPACTFFGTYIKN
jgi:hypothetical protein